MAGAAGGLGIIAKLIIALIVLGIVGAGALYFFGSSIVGGSTTPAPALQTFSQNGTVPATFSTIFQNPNTSMTKLSALINTSLSSNAVRQFHVNYTGTVYLKSSSKALSILGTISSPVYMWLAQYNSSKHLSFTAGAASLLGSLNVQWLSSSYVCTNFNAKAASQGNITALLGSRQSMCVKGNGVGGVNFSQIYNFNFNGLSSYGLNFVYGKSYQSNYLGTPCTVVTGTVTGSGHGSFIMCMSDVYYVPLSIGFNVTGASGSMAIFLNETSIGNTANQSIVTTLPYPTT